MFRGICVSGESLCSQGLSGTSLLVRKWCGIGPAGTFVLPSMYSEMSPERNVRSVQDRKRPVILTVHRTDVPLSPSPHAVSRGAVWSQAMHEHVTRTWTFTGLAGCDPRTATLPDVSSHCLNESIVMGWTYRSLVKRQNGYGPGQVLSSRRLRLPDFETFSSWRCGKVVSYSTAVFTRFC